MSISKIGLTPLQASEFDHCAQDFIYFLKTYVVGKDNAKFPFEEYHNEWYQAVKYSNRLCNVKFHDSGFGAIALAFNLWSTLFVDGVRTRWIAKNDRELQNVIHRFENMCTRLPDWLNPNPQNEYHVGYRILKLKNRSALEFDDCSIIGNPNPGSYTLLIMDDAAFYHLGELAWKDGLSRLITNNGKVIAQSIPNGVKDPFYAQRTAGVDKTTIAGGSWTHLSIPYTRCSLYQKPEYVQGLRKKYNALWFAENVEGRFLSAEEKKKIDAEDTKQIDDFIARNVNGEIPGLKMRGFGLPPSVGRIINPPAVDYEYEGFRLRNNPNSEFIDCCAKDYSGSNKPTCIDLETRDSGIDFSALGMPDVSKMHVEWNDEEMADLCEIGVHIDEMNEDTSGIINDTATLEEIRTVYDNLEETVDGGYEPKKMLKKKKKIKSLQKQCQDLVGHLEGIPEIREPKTKDDPSITCDLLKLAGVVSLDRECGDDDDAPIDYRVILTSKIAEKGLPEEINLEFDDENLLVNGTRTKISTQSIEMAFVGLAQLITPDEALEKVGRLVRKKLAYVF